MQEASQGGNWSDLVSRRLTRSMVLSTLLLAAILSFIRIQLDATLPADNTPILEITLPPTVEAVPPELVPDEVPVDEPETEEAPPAEAEVEEADDDEEELPDAVEPATEPAATASYVDWYAELERVSAEIAAREAEPNSVNPHFDELRRVARLRYGKPQNNPPRPIWENVETDYLGRTILRDGDCFRIIEDPSVGNRYVFENFQQYMVYCTYQPSRPRDLPWVKEIQSRYGYLRRDEEYLVPQECTDCENQ